MTTTLTASIHTEINTGMTTGITALILTETSTGMTTELTTIITTEINTSILHSVTKDKNERILVCIQSSLEIEEVIKIFKGV